MIRSISVDDFFARPETDGLVEGYTDECAIAGLPRPRLDIEMYKALEEYGPLQAFAAFDGNEMIGYLFLLLARNPHYSAIICTIESIYVAKERRARSGAGLALLGRANQVAIDGGAVGLLVSAPAGSAFEAVLEKMDLEKTNQVFFRSFAK